jgi:hypothetical protein
MTAAVAAAAAASAAVALVVTLVINKPVITGPIGLTFTCKVC